MMNSDKLFIKTGSLWICPGGHGFANSGFMALN